VINHECRRLERIVGDMLSVSEIEAGSFKLRTGDVRLETVFEELQADYGPQAGEKKVDLQFELPPKLPAMNGDCDKIVLALHNLIGNAVKYTPAGGRVVVRVVIDARQLMVEVADTGIGVSADETELIFEKFYRAKDKRVSEITGTGLGLSLAREVVRLHGGDISVRSELNKGSTFTLTVPTLQEAA
jgi:signal transduction histidine kinase